MERDQLRHTVRVQVTEGVPGVQALIELRLGVKTSVRHVPQWGWFVEWSGPKHADNTLDFLRPHILPPRD